MVITQYQGFNLFCFFFFLCFSHCLDVVCGYRHLGVTCDCHHLGATFVLSLSWCGVSFICVKAIQMNKVYPINEKKSNQWS